MNTIETEDVVGFISAAYPSHFKNLGTEDIDGMILVWTEIFKDEEAQIVSAAAKSFVATDTKGFPPVPGQIKNIILKLLSPEIMTEVEAWGLVKKAIRNSAYNSIEEYEKLPEIIQEIISSDQLKDWALANIDDESVISSNFMRSFKVKVKRKEELSALPNDIKLVIGNYTKMLE